MNAALLPVSRQRAGRKADQDLRDRQPEVEHRLAESLERQEHDGDMKAWVADAGKQDGILAAADVDSSSLRRHGRVTRIQRHPLPEWIAMTAPTKLIPVLALVIALTAACDPFGLPATAPWRAVCSRCCRRRIALSWLATTP